MTKRMKFILLLIVLIFTSLYLAACGSAKSASFPTGKFALGNDGVEGFQFNKDGSWAYFYNGANEVEGTYSTDGDIYTELTNNVPSDDPNCKVPSKYNWSFDGKILRFSLVEDKCMGRRDAYTSQLYTLVK